MVGIRWSEAKVGLMVILAAVLLVMITVAVGNFGDIFSDTVTIQIETPSVVGLENYAPVTYSGVRIGRVINIRYDESKRLAVIVADVDRNAPISLDSICRFTSASLLSSLFIEISGGSTNLLVRDLLAQGKIKESEIRLKSETYLSIGDVFSLAGDVKMTLSKFNQTLDNVNGPLGTASALVQDISGELKGILKNVHHLVTEGDRLLTSVLENANGLIVDSSANVIPALRDIRTSMGKFPTLVDDVHSQISHVMDSAGDLIVSASPQLHDLVGDLRDTLQELRRRVAILEERFSRLLQDSDALIVENRQDVDAIIDYLKRTSKNLDDIMDQLSRNPWRLVWKTDELQKPARVSPQWNPPLPESP